MLTSLPEKTQDKPNQSAFQHSAKICVQQVKDNEQRNEEAPANSISLS